MNSVGAQGIGFEVIVITGSTRGIGYGLAEAFLDLGCRVVVGGRSQASTDHAVVALAETHDPEHIFGKPCDVRHFEQVATLWRSAKNRYGRVDVWINNAGLGTDQQDVWSHDPAVMATLVETNLLGTMHGAKVAVQGMLAQSHTVGRPAGAVYMMEGLGSDGRRVEGLTLYGTTKRAIRYFTEGLVKETAGTSVLVGALSPGMVTTDLLLGPYERGGADWERAKRIFNILADKPETVCPWLARKVLTNTRHGACLRWLTFPKILWRFLSAPFVRRDLFGAG
jgi:NAD(P)-dependent dehydrogenase (short-subunit alcohol dehydrogenase family)